MYNKDKPYNDLPGLPPKYDFDEIEMLKLVNKANIALASCNGTAKLLPTPSIIFEPLSVQEAVASSGVENINTTVSDVFKAELFPEEKINNPQQETLHYKDALMKGWNFVKQNGFLATNDYIELQAELKLERSGIRRKDQVKKPVTIVNSKTKEVIYTPPEEEGLIRELLKNYERYYNDPSNNDDIDPLIKLALLHYQFEAIHPFGDGNGRTGRILMVLYLVLCQRINAPMLFISGYILKHRDEYYKLLRGVTEEGKWKEWVIYILTAVIEQSKATEKTIMDIQGLMNIYKAEADGKSLPCDSNFVDYLFSKPLYTYNDLTKKVKIHRNTSIKYLNLLFKAGVLEKTRYKKENIFYNPKFLDLL